jgi:two-component system sensor histidine kinase DesK
LGLALREAITNVLRHSGAQSVMVTLARKPQAFEITVEDDGGADAPTPGGGLTGMRGRLETLGGALDIGHGAAGVRLIMRLPLNTALEGA